MALDLDAIQSFLHERDLDGWLLADFHTRNTVAIKLLSLPKFLTRRGFYYIPADGEPVGLIHAVEADKWQHLPGKLIEFSGYVKLEQFLKDALQGARKVAMEYSPMGRLPYVGLVDCGTIELVRSFGIEVVSSADLVANFQARLTPEQTATHRIAATNLMEIKEAAFGFIATRLNAGETVLEFDVVRFILDQFANYDMETEFPPLCAVDANAGNPHYEPIAENSAELSRGQLILIDLWAKLKHGDGIYADITWMGFAGSRDDIPMKYRDIFAVLIAARDAAVRFVQTEAGQRTVMGYEVDDVCRKVVVDAGYGEYFTHRTGHSIHAREHGPGPNIDNLETEDRRYLQPGHLFSIEPGIYMPDCGFRTEIDVLMVPDGAEVTTAPLQTEIKALF